MAESLITTINRQQSSDECICGDLKKPGRILCVECWQALPASLRVSVSTASGDSWYQAVDEANDYIRIETERIPK